MAHAQEQRIEGGPYATAYDNQKLEVWWIDYARALDITWSEDTRYWRWVKEKSCEDLEVAELLQVCWLDVSGKLATTGLRQGTRYEIVLVAKLKTKNYGFDDHPVNIKFTPPYGKDPKTKTINLAEFLKPRDQWKDIPIGEFIAPANPGNLEFSLYEHGGTWKSGLVIKGAAVQKKN